MTDARIILWFIWFVACNYLRNIALLIRDRLLREACSVRKALSLFLTLLFVAGAFLAVPKQAAAQSAAHFPPGKAQRLFWKGNDRPQSGRGQIKIWLKSGECRVYRAFQRCGFLDSPSR